MYRPWSFAGFGDYIFSRLFRFSVIEAMLLDHPPSQPQCSLSFSMSHIHRLTVSTGD